MSQANVDGVSIVTHHGCHDVLCIILQIPNIALFFSTSSGALSSDG